MRPVDSRPPDAQEPGTQAVGFRSKPLYVQKFGAGGKHPALRTVVNDIPRKTFRKSRHAGKQFHTGIIEFDTDPVHAAYHNIVQGLFQCALIDVMLILPDPDGLRVNL